MREMMVIVSWNFCTTCVLYISVMLRRRFPACSWFVLCILRFYLTNQEENGSKQDSRKSVWSRRRWSVSPTALTENNTDLIWPAEFQSSPTTRTLWTPRGLRKRWEISNAAGLIFFFHGCFFSPLQAECADSCTLQKQIDSSKEEVFHTQVLICRMLVLHWVLQRHVCMSIPSPGVLRASYFGTSVLTEEENAYWESACPR